jgi:hypothetical protein
MFWELECKKNISLQASPRENLRTQLPRTHAHATGTINTSTTNKRRYGIDTPRGLFRPRLLSEEKSRTMKSGIR